MEIHDYTRRFDEAIHVAADVLAAREAFAELAADQAALHGAVRQFLRHLADDGLYLPRSVAQSQLVLSPQSGADARYDLALGRYAAPGSSVVTHCIYGLFASLGDPLRIEHYRLPAGWDGAIFSGTVRLERLDDFELRRGEVLAIAPGRDT